MAQNGHWLPNRDLGRRDGPRRFKIRGHFVYQHDARRVRRFLEACEGVDWIPPPALGRTQKGYPFWVQE
jgi:hypothetical protein